MSIVRILPLGVAATKRCSGDLVDEAVSMMPAVQGKRGIAERMTRTGR
ncbi:MAG TPA: hypothetical protein VN823_22475 [Stellaceae bacterium]|nr:hypothetical protein [Stellaceae bacterium]